MGSWVYQPGEDGAPGADGADGAPGADGKSAYEIAVEGGFTGTEAEWLDSLVGPEGPSGSDGADGAEGTIGATPYEQIEAVGPTLELADSTFGHLLPNTAHFDQIEMFPVGMIISWTGTYGQVPNGWLLCHGQDLTGYETDLLRLYQMIPDFHGVGFFHTPDFRGRSPIGSHIGPGASPQEPVRDIPLGTRLGDWRVPYHRHFLPTTGTGGGYPAIQYHDSTADINHLGGGLTGNPRPDSIDTNGTGANLPPSTGVNFLIYCGQDTSAIKDRDDLGNVSAVTARMMIESRLAEAGVDPEEVKMLKEQLEALKTAEAS